MLKVLSINDIEQWDSIVTSFQDYDIYWLSGYVKAFQIHGDGEPLLFYYEGSGVRGINVVMKRDVSKDAHFMGKLPENEYFDFSTPYGYGGWIVEGDGLDNLFKEYEKWCRGHGIISEFVRFHPVMQNHQRCTGAYTVVPLGNTVVVDLSSKEEIWANFTSQNRNKVRKAKKNGIQVYNGRYPEIFEEFRIIYNSTMDKDEADEYYYFGKDFYQSVLDDLAENAQIFYAVYEGKVIAATIILAIHGKVNYHLSGSLREYAHLAPTNLLLYEVAKWGCANDYKTLYLGGGVGSGEDSLYKFKTSFNRNNGENTFYIGKKIFQQERYDKLLAMRSPTDSSFFPTYRA